MFTPRPWPYDERLARLFAALEEAHTLIERRAAAMASARAVLAEAEAALERSRRARERLAWETDRARRDLTCGQRRARHP